tara:strand:- start:300 stop:548 length:249 start_codon:yes stop_codon:yes gene_type:complete
MVNMIVGLFFAILLYYYFYLVNIATDNFLGDKGKIYFKQDIQTMDSIPNNAKSKATTKKRWARSTHDNSFADAIMWGDLGND